MPSYSRVANGNISPSRFVKQDTTVVGKVLQTSATTDPVYGISQPGTRNPPYPLLDDGFAAIAGENLFIYGPPDKDVMLELGGTVTQGDSLTSDSSGRGITTTSTGNFIGAIAMANGTIGQLIPVECVPSTKY